MCSSDLAFSLLLVLALDAGGEPDHHGKNEDERGEENRCEFPRHPHHYREGCREGDDDSNYACAGV